MRDKLHFPAGLSPGEKDLSAPYPLVRRVHRAQGGVNASPKNISFIIYTKPTRCKSGSIVFIKNYKYALHVSDALGFHLQEHYKL